MNKGKIKDFFFLHNLKIVVPVLLFFFSNLFANPSIAQLQAAFTINKEGGCKPLTVQFTNTSTGTSAGVTYAWDFGNGNTSALVSPGATYVDEKVYTVTLTARQGSETSTTTRQITVYKTPSVDFTASPAKGCMPLEVSFTSTATPGDGGITRYLWDFGDGQASDGAAITSPKLTYTFAQQAPVSLTVTNSFGCFNTKTYSGMVEVYPEVKVEFEANKQAVCKSGESVRFINKSTGGTLSKFEWDFGDGTTSVEKAPEHIYNKEGVFDVKLKVTNSNGCTDEKVMAKYIRVGSFGQKIDFNRESIKCTGFDFTTFYAAHDGDGYDYRVRWFLNDVPVSSYQEHLFDLYHNDTGTYKIRADFDFYGCKVSAQEEVTIYPKVEMGGMVIKRSPSCKPPFEITFSDTTKDVVKWTWTFWHASVPDEKRGLKEFTHSFPYELDISPTVFLGVENKYGCKAQDVKSFNLKSPQVGVYLLDGPDGGVDCKKRISKFGASLWSPDADSFLTQSLVWDFGDTIIRGVTTLSHQFKTSTAHNIYFSYKTAIGCTDTIKYVHTPYQVADELDFSITPDDEICGNNFFSFLPKGVREGSYNFYFGDWKALGTFYDIYPYSIPSFQIRDSGVFDIHMVFNKSSQGYCIDTLTKKNFLTIKPPFSGIGGVVQTCDGDRGLVKIADISRFASFWEWDFGDGTKKTYTVKPDTVEHHYKQSGNYKVYQRVRFESCEVLDSVIVKVFLKQKPIVSISRDSMCLHEHQTPFTVTIADSSTFLGNLARDFYRHYEAIYYPGGYSRGGYGFTNGYRNGYSGHLYPDSAGFTSIRIAIGSDFCSDTSESIPFKVKGPSAHFGVQNHWKCFNDTIRFLDASQGNLNVPIVKWDWEFVKGNKLIKNSGGNFGYKYDRPGNYYPRLKVTDAEGCHDETNGYLYAGGELWLEGPKAVIGASSFNIPINSTINFSNNSFGRFPWQDGKYTWYMPDGTVISEFEPPAYLFENEGEYVVKLVSGNPYFDCIDSTTQKIIVRKVNAQFTHSISYVNNNGCPPAIVRFTSTTVNAERLGWNFGDGGTGGNQTFVTHTYNQPGVYQVWHYSYDENNNVDSSFDFIEIKGPYALISADKFSACNNLQVTLNAEVKNADSYTWDLGDGTISSSSETKISHKYLTTGQYTPSLILEDGAGCKATSVLPQKIIVDSLNADFSFAPSRICAGSRVAFTGQTSGFSANQLNAQLTYKWLANNVQQGTEKNFGYAFNTPGSNQVKFEVSSPYGCQVVVQKALQIEPPLYAAIAGKTSVCKGDTASFMASAAAAGLTWRWLIQGQATSIISAQTSPVQWNTPGNYAISLLADNGACTDSVVHLLTVNDLPTITTEPQNAWVCIGDTLNLTVQGNGMHIWQPNAALKQADNNLARVSPKQDSWFKVQSLSAQGCRASDSIQVTVVKPLRLQAAAGAEACLGEPVNLSAFGADTFQWVPALGLSNAATANPVASITASTTYQVIGRDQFGCFADTATVRVTIHPLPIVDAGPDAAVLGGESVSLNATSNLPGVRFLWTPDTFLSCTNCADPVSRPLNDISYLVRATTAKGCASTDSLNITVLCSKETIFIPTGFTPNGDGLNDRFGILGGGVTYIKYFRITDRWGKTVFERNNIAFGSASSYWDGNYPNGLPAASGSYIYAVEVTCSTGTAFSYSGSVKLLR